ncbi:MAG: dehydrogenase [Chloroflexi bacterium]|nr:dehydrogenase [Chloroflexota bacterium]
MAASPPNQIAPAEAGRLKGMLARMLLIRAFDTRGVELALSKTMPGYIHSSVGQEAVGVGICTALRPDDYAVTTHRGHAHVLAKGADPKPMMAELFGRTTGSNRGKGGSLHITDVSVGMLGAISVLGENMPLGVGAALGSRVLGQDRVSVVFFGDGAAAEGALHESLNIAGIRKLPVIFVCEDNQYAVSTRTRESGSLQDPGDMGAPYRIPTITVDGNDVLAVYDAAQQAVQRARSGDGPTIIDCKTYRHYSHNSNIAESRSDEEIAEWKGRDPIARFSARLVDLDVLTPDEADEMAQAAQAAIDEAIEFAKQSPWPGPSEAVADVYAPAYIPPRPTEAGPTMEITFREGVRQALAFEMQRDPSMVLIGTSVGSGGTAGTAAGLLKQYGPDRVVNTPIAELAFVGLANGAALVGCRPVVDFSHIDFSGLSLDQVCNLSAKLRHMTGGQTAVPMVLRLQSGAAGRLAQTHSQSLEAWYYHLPGLKLAMPYTPADARGLLLTAIRDDNPVIFLEHRGLYNAAGPVHDEPEAIPFGQAAVRRSGGDVTLIAWGMMVKHALAAAGTLAGEGVEAEVIDLRTLIPLDLETLAASVERTGRAVICQEATLQGGVGSDIARQLYRRTFDRLAGPIEVTGSAWAPIPYSPDLEAAVLPGVDVILAAARETRTRPSR